MTDRDFDAVSGVVARVIAAQVVESPAYLQKALRLPLRQDVVAEGGILLGARDLRNVSSANSGTPPGLRAFGGLLHFAIGGAVVGAPFPVVDAVVDAKHRASRTGATAAGT